MFSITLYQTNDPRNKISKNLFGGLTLSGEIRGDVDIIDPVVYVEIAHIDGITQNYVYIGEFLRYYFIVGKREVRTGLWELRLHVDVLMTYANSIKDLRVTIDKQQGTFINNYFNDNSFFTDCRRTKTLYNFPNGFSETGHYILTTAGGS